MRHSHTFRVYWGDRGQGLGGTGVRGGQGVIISYETFTHLQGLLGGQGTGVRGHSNTPYYKALLQ